MNHKVTVKWNLKAGLDFQKKHFFRYQGKWRAWGPSTHQFSRGSTDDLPLPIPGREGREGEGREGEVKEVKQVKSKWKGGKGMVKGKRKGQ